MKLTGVYDPGTIPKHMVAPGEVWHVAFYTKHQRKFLKKIKILFWSKARNEATILFDSGVRKKVTWEYAWRILNHHYSWYVITAQIR